MYLLKLRNTNFVISCYQSIICSPDTFSGPPPCGGVEVGQQSSPLIEEVLRACRASEGFLLRGDDRMRHGVSTVPVPDVHQSLQMFHNLPIGVAVWQLRDLKDVRSFWLVGVNPAAEREARAPLGFAVGKFITENLPNLLETNLPDRWRHAVLSGRAETLGECVYGDSRIAEGVFWVECFPLPDHCVGVAMENITERKRTSENQFRALQLLHSITIHLNGTATVLEAAQFCVDHICTEIAWPVGRFFLSDDDCPSRFLPNPVWHFSDTHRFNAFRKATELYEQDLTNKLALEYRSIQGKKAGLRRSIGFSVIEDDSLRGVLEFSSEHVAPLDVNIFRAISNVGFQLGQVFARTRLGGESSYIQGPMLSLESPQAGVRKVPAGGKSSVLETSTLGSQHRAASQANAALSKEIRQAMRMMHHNLDELKRLTAKPAVLRSAAAS